ncbi:MAG: hypothetical protein OEX15_00660, partial [Gammaproteobacteria bacterium]|nr:hypothetical protein [Gammaproteobacteria bacterium]
MNEQESLPPPDTQGETEQPGAPALQRAFMDRARRAAEHEHAPAPGSVWHRVVAIVAALALTGGIVFVFDAFLGSM